MDHCTASTNRDRALPESTFLMQLTPGFCMRGINLNLCVLSKIEDTFSLGVAHMFMIILWTFYHRLMAKTKMSLYTNTVWSGLQC